VQRILTKTIFINCAAYLRIIPSRDILDTTRIHPSHYDLARKMAADALDVDDPHDEYGQPSEHVHEMITSRQTYRLDELILEEYAKELERVTGEPLYRILIDISQEIKQPFRELCRTWHEPPLEDVFERLTGETPQSLHVGVIVMVRITKVQRDYANAQLESGLDGLIMRNNANETEPISTQDVLRPGENLLAAVIKVEQDRFLVELSLRQSDLDQARHTMKYEAVDPAFDRIACEQDEALIKEMKTRNAANQTSQQDRRQPRRILQHPLFRNVTAAAAEAYLDRRHVGDCVIRPSYSRGSDHMVVVWKVHDGIYKHIGKLYL
jgi:transcription elongation factor SPT6